jgi:hypothetical protein
MERPLPSWLKWDPKKMEGGVIDNTTLANNVRGLEVQAYSGTNTQGVNTGIISFGKTFGVQGVTDGTAGAVSVPAALFGYLNNQTAPTAGNAIRAYTDYATSATLVQIYQASSSYSGTGLLMNLGNSGGIFTGKYLDLQVAGTSRIRFVHCSSRYASYGSARVP